MSAEAEASNLVLVRTASSGAVLGLGRMACLGTPSVIVVRVADHLARHQAGSSAFGACLRPGVTLCSISEVARASEGGCVEFEPVQSRRTVMTFTAFLGRLRGTYEGGGWQSVMQAARWEPDLPIRLTASVGHTISLPTATWRLRQCQPLAMSIGP